VGRGRPSLRENAFVATPQRSRSLGALDVPDLADVVVPAELVADLYDPHLVITAHYVGTDPRYRERHSLSLVAGALVALVSAALAVALTLALTHPAVGSAEAPSAPTHAVATSPPPTPQPKRGADRAARVPAGTTATPSRPATQRSGSGRCQQAAAVASSPTCARPSAVRRRAVRAARAAARATHRSAGGRGPMLR
jgi:hypothetical protein